MFLAAWLLKAIVAVIQLLPLRTVARTGRLLGWIAWHVDRRHRRIALDGLKLAFGKEFDEAQRIQIARENFCRLGENYLGAVKTASMTSEELSRHLEFHGVEKLMSIQADNVIFAVGHFGNFELYARLQGRMPGWRVATTFRALRQPALNEVLQSLRQKSGALFFERRHGGADLIRAMNQKKILLGLLSDQHGGDRGIWLPFFGTICSCSPAPSILAQRYKARLAVGICYRTALAHWRVEVGSCIPTVDADGEARPVKEITEDIHREFERAIRRDPANWFWVHRRWKPPGPRVGASRSN